jgi:hypothetical protein
MNQYNLFLILFIILFLVGLSVINNLLISLIIALLISSVSYYFYLNNVNYETFKNKRKKKKNVLTKRYKKLLASKNFPNSKYTFDSKKTYKELYKNLGKKQKKGLNKDTQDLIDTQTKLMNTLTEMGPVLSQGKNILSAFDNFFGKSKSNDIDYMKKRLQIK